jgi:hypothetical protein
MIRRLHYYEPYSMTKYFFQDFEIYIDRNIFLF